MIIQANALQLPIASNTVQCVVTSPPYWGLRDYGIAAGQLGLERTPEEYVANMVAVFREVKRVLKNDGTLWLNLGDSYNAHPGQRSLKAKDLIGIPWRVAFALQADGWYLRSDIIWSKPNPMPESVTDRPTKAHEYLFLLAKSERYFYDADAIKEPSSPDTHARYARGRSDSHKWADGGPGDQTIAKSFEHMRKPVGGWATGPGDHSAVGHAKPKYPAPAGSGIKANESFSAAVKDIVETRNARSVWNIATQPWSGAHFATFPEKLVEPCVLAGSRPGDIVFDPFLGSGTVIRVATRLQRKGVGCDLNFDYLSQQARKRSRNVQVELQYQPGGINEPSETAVFERRDEAASHSGDRRRGREPRRDPDAADPVEQGRGPGAEPVNSSDGEAQTQGLQIRRLGRHDRAG